MNFIVRFFTKAAEVGDTGRTDNSRVLRTAIMVIEVGEVGTVLSSQLRGTTLKGAKVMGGGNVGCIREAETAEIEG
jgi:hypothetical protein